MQFLVLWLSAVLRNPVELQFLLSFLESAPGISVEVRNDIEVVAALAQVWATKKNGTLVYRPDDGSPEIIVRPIKF